jgi:hypothetical protein
VVVGADMVCAHLALLSSHYNATLIVHTVRSSPRLSTFVRAISNSTLAASNAPWAYFYKVIRDIIIIIIKIIKIIIINMRMPVKTSSFTNDLKVLIATH